MYVCLCLGITNTTVSDAVARGATTTRQIAAACGAGSECGRCRRTVRAVIESLCPNPDIAEGNAL
ncbi:(2Fe-2S)-binding protein [Mycolicibacterium sp. 120266]|uniref:(2Fe-2S)-binding protein n=1 Tax=Mycolicibacterium sp. 120266 TaxID=3090601 RepID=UPI00299F2424|nr:(2Fe-2S)-binding protein [Mycolicibacterium sp. 120266]MDX1873907.1 (2Fe-2S)-binding protein [Mycolicibacterium sp. 120266]